MVGLFIIVEREYFSYSLSSASRCEFVSHEMNPLTEVDLFVAIFVEVGNHLEDNCIFHIEAKWDHSCLEF